MASPELGRLYQGVAKESAAFRLMKQMGWEEGQGLGKHKQGISTHVRVTKKFDTSGIGVAEAQKAASNWTVNTAVFDSILKNLNIKATQGAAAEPSKEAEEEPSEAAAPAKEGKGGAPATAEVARPKGSYLMRRKAGKCVKSYSESDLSAILGVAAAASAPRGSDSRAPPAPEQAQPAGTMFSALSTDSDSEESRGADEQPPRKVRKTGKGSPGSSLAKKEKKKQRAEQQGSDEEGKKAKGKKGKEGKKSKKARKGEEEAGQQPGECRLRHAKSEPALDACAGSRVAMESASAPPPPPAADWWGHRSGFVAGGVLGAAGRAKEEREKGFSEADQEGLYHLVQNTATSGKKGLGIGSMPRKVAGARWKGQKVTFQEDAEASGSLEAGDKAAERAAHEESGAAEAEPTCAKKRKRVGSEAPGAAGESPEGAGVGLRPVKWRKLILKLLQKEPDGMSVVDLKQKSLRRAAKAGGDVPSGMLEAAFDAEILKLTGSEIKVVGKLVRIS